VRPRSWFMRDFGAKEIWPYFRFGHAPLAGIQAKCIGRRNGQRSVGLSLTHQICVRALSLAYFTQPTCHLSTPW
jgi:hypothetical protein